MANAIPTKFGSPLADAVSVASVSDSGSLPFMKGGEPLFIDKGSEVGLLLLHGFTSTPHQFRELSKFLVDRGFTVYSPLIAGHGTSPKEMSKTTGEDWAKSAEEALHHLRRYVRRVVIVGNSFGGNLAFWLAHRYPDLVSGIVSLGTPIKLRAHLFLLMRTYTYGLFMTYHRKSGREYKVDYIDLSDQVSYPVIPIRCLREFFRFIRTRTIPTLESVTTPTLMIQADQDPVVHPKSAPYIHQHLGSNHKKMYWLNGRYHNLPYSDRREEIFHKVDEFIQELEKEAA